MTDILLPEYLAASWSTLDPKDREFCLMCWKHMSAEGLAAGPLKRVLLRREQNREYDPLLDLKIEAARPTTCFGLSCEPRLCTVCFPNRTLFAHTPMMALFAATLLRESVKVIVHDEYGLTEAGLIARGQYVQFRPVDLTLYVNFDKHPSEPLASALDVNDTWARRQYSAFFNKPSFSADKVSRSLQSLRKKASYQSRHL